MVTAWHFQDEYKLIVQEAIVQGKNTFVFFIKAHGKSTKIQHHTSFDSDVRSLLLSSMSLRLLFSRTKRALSSALEQKKGADSGCVFLSFFLSFFDLFPFSSHEDNATKSFCYQITTAAAL